jgi:DNA-binding transcriptional ArsR family regulator
MDIKVDEAVSEGSAVRLAELFRALGDVNRIHILVALLQEEMNVSSLASAIGISESAVSHHLRNLRLLHLVRTRKEGRQVYYRLDDDHIIELLKSGMDHVQHG